MRDLPGNAGDRQTIEAYLDAQLSEGQLARRLGVDRLTARQLVQEYQADEARDDRKSP